LDRGGIESEFAPLVEAIEVLYKGDLNKMSVCNGEKEQMVGLKEDA
jgi:hypothetical protein